MLCWEGGWVIWLPRETPLWLEERSHRFFTKEEEGWLYFLRYAPPTSFLHCLKKEAETRTASLAPFSLRKFTGLGIRSPQSILPPRTTFLSIVQIVIWRWYCLPLHLFWRIRIQILIVNRAMFYHCCITQVSCGKGLRKVFSFYYIVMYCNF